MSDGLGNGSSDIPIELEPAARRRAMTGIFLCSAVIATGYIPAVSIAPLIAEVLLGSPLWSGIPAAVTIAGSALGTTLLSALMIRRSRRFGLTLGLGVAALAAGLAAVAIQMGWFLVFLGAMALFGAGNGSRHLSRYAAGDLYAIEFRGRAIAIVIWAGTIGSVLGPLLLAPSQTAATRIGSNGYVGPYLLAMIAMFLSFLLFLFLVPHLPYSRNEPIAAAQPSLYELLRQPKIRFALVAMALGHFVMVLIMSMTALHINHSGKGLATVGLVFSAHTLGMFGLSPLAGLLSDRWGRFPVIVCGQFMVLMASLMVIPLHGSQTWLLVGALFLLGLGWNFGFVAGSALLTESVRADLHVRLQGAADAFVWTTAAISSVSSGLIMTAAGYRALGVIGATLALMVLGLAMRSRELVAREPTYV
jgi:MFS family permease